MCIRDRFPAVDGTLDFAIIDDKYAFSYVFKGNFKPVLLVFGTKD